MRQLQILISLVFAINSIAGQHCPDSRLLTPCTCEEEEMGPEMTYSTLFCGGHHELDLKALFANYSRTLVRDPTEPTFKDYQFTKLYLNNTAIRELKAHTFRNVTFGYIYIADAMSLETISGDAFDDSYNLTVLLHLWRNPRLTNGPNNSLWDAVSKFKIVNKVQVLDNNISEIPDNAFRPLNGNQSNLRNIEISGNSITKIGDKAFSSLSANLVGLSITNTSITSIGDNALYFETPSGLWREISLVNNPGLTPHSYTHKTFGHLLDETHLSLSNVYFRNTGLKYLEEQVFRPFFESNVHNAIDVDNRAFDCKDPRNQWLITSGLIKRLFWTDCHQMY